MHNFEIVCGQRSFKKMSDMGEACIVSKLRFNYIYVPAQSVNLLTKKIFYQKV